LSIYADSSFFVSSYILDAHTAEAMQRMSHHPGIWLTSLNRAEIVNAIYRYVFRGVISETEARAAFLNFEQDRKSGLWIEIELPSRIWDRNIDLVSRYTPTFGNRTIDSLHIAAALELGAKEFWTFDTRQLRLAKAVGLKMLP
jgi:predicted nucleic acid-binding protein